MMPDEVRQLPEVDEALTMLAEVVRYAVSGDVRTPTRVCGGTMCEAAQMLAQAGRCQIVARTDATLTVEWVRP